jgi:cytosine/uracil/thiamine/allantoin permease
MQPSYDYFKYYGTTSTVAATHGEKLLKMQYRLRTALGYLETFCEHTKGTNIQETGQGTCASPSIWLLICSILMYCFSELGGRMFMLDVTSKTIQQWIDWFADVIQQWIDWFADDTSLFVNIDDVLRK